MQNITTGALAIYRNKSAAVAGIRDDKIEIRIEGGDSKSVRLKDIEVLHPGPVSTLPPPEKPLPECAELAELMGGETLPFGEFAELAYSDRSVSSYWSAWKLLEAGIYFEGSPASGVRARPAEAVAATLAALREKSEKEERRAALVERIRSGALLPEDRSAMREIEQVALGRSESSRLLRELGIEATPVKAHQLLLRLGVWNLSVDPWPERAGVELTVPGFELGPLPDEPREDLTGQTAFAIDDAGSTDPDDAIAFEDGLLWVHVADPAAVVTPESEADLEAGARGENLYLPERIVPMLPPQATERFGLGLAESSPALSFAIRIDAEGEAELVRFCLSTVRVQRLTYAGAREYWDRPPLSEIRPLLERFKMRRREAGALMIDLPEVKISLEGKQVRITPIELTPERELVANAMLAAGSAVAKWADANALPFPFATQPSPETTPEEAARATTLSEMYALRKSCPPSSLQTSPSPHSGLGLPLYARVTSPLRRYGDLLCHQQLRRVLAGEEPLSAEYLEHRLAESEREALVRRRLERQANEFWTCVYLAQHPDWNGDAVMVFRQDDRLTYLIPELAYEFKNRFGGKIALGERLHVRLAGCDPALVAATFRIE